MIESSEPCINNQPFAVRLPTGGVNVGAKAANGGSLHKIVLTPILPESKLGVRFERFEKRSAWLGVHLGLVEIAAVHSHP